MLEEESPMPYFFDIVDYTHLTHEGMKNHIDRVGVFFYSREDNTMVEKSKDVNLG